MSTNLISPSVYEYRHALLQSWHAKPDRPQPLLRERMRRVRRRTSLTLDDRITFLPGPARPEPNDNQDNS